tara:strand:+ start:916 stop:1068 length:153 start_codon:yes stop_codon:yes gene_type:complete
MFGSWFKILIVITCVAILFQFGVIQAVLTVAGAFLIGIATLLNFVAGLII